VVFAFIGAKRRALTEQADGSGAGFSQEGQKKQPAKGEGLVERIELYVDEWSDLHLS